MQSKGLRDVAKEQLWRETIALQQESGLSQSAFCSQKGLNANTFSSWKHILEKRDEAQRKSRADKGEKPRAYKEQKREQLFVEVAPAQEQVPPQEQVQVLALPAGQPQVVAEITFSGGAVRIIAGADVKTLRALIQALKED